jgi:transposase
LMVAAEVDPERLVFVDEMGVHTSLAPLYGYAPKGERLRLEVPRNRGKNTTLLASITLGGMGDTMAVEGSTDRGVFEAYIEHALAPTLEAGRVVIMDNLPAHKPARVRELIEERGCELIYLPAYSPDLNPIEEAFSKIKGILRRAGARTKEALLEVLGERFRRSAPETLEATSSMPAIAHKPNYCETCCKLNFVELRKAEVRRTRLLRGWVNKSLCYAQAVGRVAFASAHSRA